MAFFSTNSGDYAAAINRLTKPEYESKYGSTIGTIMDKIANKEKFSYDFNADPLYQNYKDQYAKLGNEASMNAVANTSAMTGGFANSYSATAASQANQQYLTQLNAVIPQLYDAALNKYQMEVQDMYNQFDMYSTEENRLYGQHRDNVADYYSDLSDLRGGYGTALSNEQWQAQMEYQKSRDAVSDSQWERNYALQQAAAKKSSSGGGSSSNGGNQVNIGGLTKAYTDATERNQRLRRLSNIDGQKGQEAELQAWLDRGLISADDAEAFLVQLGILK